MKAYLIVTAVVFGAIVLAHVARLASEGANPLRQATFVGTSVLSLGLAVWAIALLRRRPR